MTRTSDHSLLLILVFCFGSLAAVGGYPERDASVLPAAQISAPGGDQQAHMVYLPAVIAVPACGSGDFIVFTSTELPQAEIGWMCSDGSQRRLLTHTPGFESTSPTWSPDKTRFAFISTIAGVRGIYIYDLSCDCVAGIMDVGLAANEPAWSPDGQRMAFTAAGGIYVVNIDGSGRTLLTDGAESAFNPSWSPDGARIVYTAWSDARRVIRIRSLDGTGYAQLPTPGSDYMPAWSPDGETIVFASGQNNTVDLYTIRADGSGLRQLTSMPASEYFATWSPDGKQVAFTVFTDGQLDIYRVDVDGSGLQWLASQAYEPAWTH